jgi:hypothetical protein
LKLTSIAVAHAPNVLREKPAKPPLTVSARFAERIFAKHPCVQTESNRPLKPTLTAEAFAKPAKTTKSVSNPKIVFLARAPMEFVRRPPVLTAPKTPMKPMSIAADPNVGRVSI